MLLSATEDAVKVPASDPMAAARAQPIMSVVVTSMPASRADSWLEVTARSASPSLVLGTGG